MKKEKRIKAKDLTFPPVIPNEPDLSMEEIERKIKSLKPRMGIIDYEVIQHISLDEFKRMVRHYLKAGWEPVGGVRYCQKMGNWYQAIILRDI